MTIETKYKRKKKKLLPAFTLVEVILVITLLGIIGAFTAPIGVDQVFRSRAQNTTIDIVSNLTLAQQNAFAGRDGYSYGISFTQSSYTTYYGTDLANPVFSETTDIAGGVEISDISLTSSSSSIEFPIGDFHPDEYGTLTLDGGGSTFVITVEAEGAIYYELNSSSQIVGSSSWTETTQADFNDGAFTQTETTTTGGGAIELQVDSVVNADWCSPELTTTTADLTGDGIANGLTAVSGSTFFGSGGTTTGLSFAYINITDADPPVPSITGTFDGYNTNGSFGETGYGYIATDDDSKEVVILDLSASPIAEVGYFNATGSVDGEAVWVDSNTGYLVQDDELRLFNLSSKTGSRSEISSFTLAGSGSSVMVVGDYAYVTTDSSSKELQIIDVSSTSSLSEAAFADITGSPTVQSLYVNSAGTRAYLGAASSGGDEVFIVDVSTKSGSRSTLGSADSGGTSVADLTTVDSGDTLIFGGSGGEEYQAWDISTESSPSYCGGVDISSGVSGIEGVTSTAGNTYTYAITGDSGAELKVIRGGTSSGGGGSQYFTTGVYESSVFDSGSATNDFTFIKTDVDVPTGTSVQMQLRAGASSDLSSETWVGLDGTSLEFFAGNGTSPLPDSFTNKRYIQYRLTYTSDNSDTPSFESIDVFYSDS